MLLHKRSSFVEAFTHPGRNATECQACYPLFLFLGYTSSPTALHLNENNTVGHEHEIVGHALAYAHSAVGDAQLYAVGLVSDVRERDVVVAQELHETGAFVALCWYYLH